MKAGQKKAVDHLVDSINKDFEDWLARLNERVEVEGKTKGRSKMVTKCSECTGED